MFDIILYPKEILTFNKVYSYFDVIFKHYYFIPVVFSMHQYFFYLINPKQFLLGLSAVKQIAFSYIICDVILCMWNVNLLVKKKKNMRNIYI